MLKHRGGEEAGAHSGRPEVMGRFWFKKPQGGGAHGGH